MLVDTCGRVRTDNPRLFARPHGGKDAIVCYEASETLLQFASIDLLLVHCLAGGVGSAKRFGNLLASSPCVVRGNVPFRNGRRLPRQLAQKSHFSLCYHWPTISHRRGHVPALGNWHDRRQHALGLAARSHRCRHRVSAGMALCAASCVVTGVISTALIES